MSRKHTGGRPWMRQMLIASLILLLPVSTTSSRGQNAPESAPQVSPATQSGTRMPSKEIGISPGDTISVNVYGTPDLSVVVRVSQDGTVYLPPLGIVHVAGLSEAAASQLLDNMYIGNHILLRPATTVLIRDFAARGVSILGEVLHPGIYPVAGPRSLVDVIALAGGLTISADSRVTIQHGDGTIDNAAISLPRENGAQTLADDVMVLPGYKIVVPRAGTVYVLGEVTRPGGYIMEHDGKITALQAIAAAQGTTRFSNEKHAFLIRRNGTGYTTQDLPIRAMYKGRSPDLPLNPEDVVYVPISNMRNFVFNAPNILGSLAGAAIYSVRQ